MDSPENQQDAPPHPLIEPRFVSAVGIAALGFGVGLALMLARIMLFWGLVISLVCAIAVIWIYYDHFRSAYRALKKKEPYNGAPPKELISAIAMIVFLIPISISVYIAMSKEEPSANRAIIVASGIVLERKDKNTHVSTTSIKNVGNVGAINNIFLVKGIITSDELPETKIEIEIDAMKKAIDKIDSEYESPEDAIQPTSGYSFNLRDIPIDKWIDHFDSKYKFSEIELSDDQFLSFNDGSLGIYALVVGRYEDEFIKGKGYWNLENCYVRRRGSMAPCWKNKVVRISQQR